ncbi:CsgG/HfaB family protein [Rhodophyticola porphyridii]|uniref:Curli production assembly/transport component CsgG n=1 Tax=Rhodophyticola porphyridii TaxID=1852017 RepID=A0A3L9Y5X5_9RHOB|nr:CsgG/HfaB family protein [Rhodophyticola porphyridii]RMA44159.1 hypothetical protein D9R08_04490 [Rhodophyticola porphyridii]
MKSIFGILALGLVTGCGTLPEELSEPRAQYFGPLPVANLTPADAALQCLSQTPEVRRSNVVFAVHVISDVTQRVSVDEVGPYIPRDAASMLVTALERAGVDQVNRINTAVSEFEIALSREQILGDGGLTQIEGETIPYRPIRRGAFRGSRYVIDGSITQLDFNTYSEGAEIGFFGLGAGRRAFALTVGADLRVTDTVSTEIVMSESYAKQAVGREVYGSIFRFFDDELFDLNLGRENIEGLHAGIRWLMAEAAYDIVSEIVNHGGSCDALLPRNFGSGTEAADELRATLARVE